MVGENFGAWSVSVDIMTAKHVLILPEPDLLHVQFADLLSTPYDRIAEA